jgi:hypothetical protein
MPHPAPPASPSPPLAKGPIWWYKARIADRAGRHKAQGPEQDTSACPSSHAGKRVTARVVRDWILEPGVALVRITRVPSADSLTEDARRQPEAGKVDGAGGDNLRDASVQQREDVEAAGNVRPGRLVPQVGAESDMAVGVVGRNASAIAAGR